LSGVIFDPTTGNFSGTPTTAGVYAGVLIATNSAASSVINYQMTVTATPTDIPTLSEWAMLILLSLLLGMGGCWMRRRRQGL